MAAEMLPIFTTQQYDQGKLQPLGAVFTQEVYPLVTSKASGGIFGSSSVNVAGKATTMKGKMREISEVLKMNLSLNARQMYPDVLALIDVRIYFNEFVSPEALYIVGSAAGTALKKKQIALVEPSQPLAPVAPVAQPFSQPLAPMPQPFSQPLAPMPQPFSQPLGPQPLGESQQVQPQVQPQVQQSQGGFRKKMSNKKTRKQHKNKKHPKHK